MATFQEELLNVLRRDNEEESLAEYSKAWENPGTEFRGPQGQVLKATSEDEKAAILLDGRAGYARLSTLISMLNPYGGEIVAFPLVKPETVADPSNLEKLDALKAAYGIEIGGWLRKNHAARPEPQELSSEEMAALGRPPDRVLHWPFQFTSDNDEDGPEQNLTITKAIKIPFLYRQPGKKRLLLAHFIIGYEGAGGE